MNDPKPHIAALKSISLDLEPGVYWWCRCGKSQNQPFCDQSHKVEGVFKPLRFEITEARRVTLCQCKHTHDAPWCDDTHKILREEMKDG